MVTPEEVPFLRFSSTAKLVGRACRMELGKGQSHTCASFRLPYSYWPCCRVRPLLSASAGLYETAHPDTQSRERSSRCQTRRGVRLLEL